MRIGIAALLGAIVIFIWQFAAHMILPIGQMGFRLPTSEDAVLHAVAAELPQPGIYILPSLDPAKMSDEVALKAWGQKSAVNPYAFVVVNASDPNVASNGMGRQLGTQFVSNFIGALLAAWLLAATAWSFAGRVIGAAVIGLFGWLANIVPHWTWYRFPPDYMIGTGIDQVVGWLLAGVAIAWWLGRGEARGFASGGFAAGRSGRR